MPIASSLGSEASNSIFDEPQTLVIGRLVIGRLVIGRLVRHSLKLIGQCFKLNLAPRKRGGFRGEGSVKLY